MNNFIAAVKNNTNNIRTKLLVVGVGTTALVALGIYAKGLASAEQVVVFLEGAEDVAASIPVE